ncbi:MAG: hypothetical protein Q4G07_05235 [Oscillospiraceae bacterium]|nr:hypothetical protein [Oscillospiraceae bacterium]
MTKEEISDALNMLSDSVIEETDRLRGQKNHIRVQKKWLRRTAAAAVFVLAAFAGGAALLPNVLSGAPAQLPMLTISQNSGGCGFEGYMAYDISELTGENPWKEGAKASVLPVYKNPVTYNEQHIAAGMDYEKMRTRLTETACRMGLDPNTLTITDNAPDEETKAKIEKRLETAGDIPEGYFDPTMLMIETEGMTITVDSSLTVDIRFEPAVQLPQEYRFTQTAYQELYKTAQYLKTCYHGLMGFQNPKLDLYGGDYDTSLYQRYKISFYDAAGSATEQLLNYCFNSAEFMANEEGALWIVRLFQYDLSQKVGDYPIISEAQARELLEAGNYITSVPYPMPGLKYVKKCELIYRTGESELYYMPYYHFYVELPQLEQDGMKTYGGYYVPAVKPEYIEDMPVWDGRFN